MARKHKVHRVVTSGKGRRNRSHCDCGKPLADNQSYYCCNACRNKYLKTHEVHYLAEPSTFEEHNNFYATVERRKAELEVEELMLIRSLTPLDDSAEAEKQLRELVSPSGDYYYSAHDL